MRLTIWGGAGTFLWLDKGSQKKTVAIFEVYPMRQLSSRSGKPPAVHQKAAASKRIGSGGNGNSQPILVASRGKPKGRCYHGLTRY